MIHEAVSGGGMVDRDLPPSWASEGSAIRGALVADFAAVPGVRVVETVDARCLDDQPALAQVTRIVADPARPVDLQELARAADAWVIVAPETDGELLKLTRAVAHRGRSLGSSAAEIWLCGDKLRLAEVFAGIGVPTPPTLAFNPSARLPTIETPSGRVVVKPVDGAGAIDTFVLANGSRCPPALLDRAAVLIQPFRPGPALSASFLVDRAGRAHLLAVGRQRIEVGTRRTVALRRRRAADPVLGPGPRPRPRSAVDPRLDGFCRRGLHRGRADRRRRGDRDQPEGHDLDRRLDPPGPAGDDRPRLAGDCVRDEGIDDPGADFHAIRLAPPVRFRADGTILGS